MMDMVFRIVFKLMVRRGIPHETIKVMLACFRETTGIEEDVDDE